MPKTKQQKIDTVATLTDQLSRAKSVVFADYKGLNMGSLSDIRNQVRDQGAEFNVTKNSLLKLALLTTNYQLPTTIFDGPTATLLSYEDEISPIKVLAKTLKDTSIGKIKGGLLNGEFMDEFSILRLASLPSKDELRAKVVGVLTAPLQGMVGVLKANLRNLVYAVDQISKLASNNEVRISKGGEVS